MDFHQLGNNSRGRKFIQECFLFRGTQKHSLIASQSEAYIRGIYIFAQQESSGNMYLLLLFIAVCGHLATVLNFDSTSHMKREIDVSISHLKPRSYSFSHKVKFPFVVHGTRLQPHPPLGTTKRTVLRVQGHLNTQKQSGEEMLP